MRRAPIRFRSILSACSALAFASALTFLSAGKGAGARPPVRRPPLIPALTAQPAKNRNVLFVLTESVRFDSVCIEHAEHCKLTPFTDRVVEGRLPLLEMRSSGSTTAISVSVLFSGLLPTETTEAVRTAPTLFDYARAAGYDTAYWSSQSDMFTGSRAFFATLPLSKRCVGSDLERPPDDAGADDALLTQRVRRELGTLREPWFAVVHYANTHFPYRQRGEGPFQPATESKAPEENASFKNHYQNAVYAQDRTIAELVSALRATPAGGRTVVIFTSDHGEAFREHGQLGHTTSLFEEEIHVPAWVDAPPAALTDGEREALAAAKHALTWHLDIAPTILDLLGLSDSPALAPFRSRMVGTSLLRRDRTAAVLPLTNCTDTWGCGFRNWGVIKRSLKLEAREYDADWRCYNLAIDPGERHDLGAEACSELKHAAEATFGKLLPKDAPAMRGATP
jgi:membrane-anchored protein YejM (alkaline phosphatase superfamily)